ncbi:MAG: hypothetical protein B7Z09_00020 [Brevundimonas diminuta]|nr:MAG: hypothetical protein B7Z09_00020 [Brevundimonas diminuta]
MKKLLNDVNTAPASVRDEAWRELGVTLVVSLCTFFVGPIVFTMLVIPTSSILGGIIDAFTGADLYIAAVSLMSISIYSISKEYRSEGRDRFGFPHATTIMCSAIIILFISLTTYSSRIVYEALPTYLQWREVLAGLIGWTVFVFACAVSYAVLVLKNDIENGGAGRQRDEQEEFVAKFNLSDGTEPA